MLTPGITNKKKNETSGSYFSKYSFTDSPLFISIYTKGKNNRMGVNHIIKKYNNHIILNIKNLNYH